MASDDIKQIKDKIDIVEYINSIVPLNSKNKACCPFHNEKTPSFTVYPDSNSFYCYGCHASGDIFEFTQKYFNKTFFEAKEILAKHAGIQTKKKTKKQIVATYDYKQNGELKFQVVRFKPKDFRQRQPIKNSNEWQWNLKGIKPIPYRVDNWHNPSRKNKTIIIVGGEKDVHSLESIKLPATCNHGGEGKFYDELIPYFKGYDVVIIPDNDKPGKDHAKLVANKLYNVAKKIRVVELPVDKPKQDITDWIEKYNGTAKDLRHLIKNTTEFIKTNNLNNSSQAREAPEDNDGASYYPLNEALPSFEWPHQKDNGKPIFTEENFRYLLNSYGIKTQYNVISKEIEISIPGTKYSDSNSLNCNLTKIQSLCQLNQLSKDSMVHPYLQMIADENSINPVLEWINSKPWDGKSRLKQFCDTISVKIGYPEEMRDLLIRKWLISCCASASMNTGYIGKGVLTFQGVQNLGKTAWVRSLVEGPLKKYVKDNIILDPSNKDSVMTCIQHWIVELGELDGTFRKSDPAKLKGFISSNCDVVRRPYERKETRFHRKTTFFASVNENSFLVDKTGNVRFWVIPVTSLNNNHNLDSQQLWAEMMSYFNDSEKWWLSPEEYKSLESLNSKHAETSPVEELILKKYDPTHNRERWVTATDVLLEIQLQRIDQKSQTECSRVLKNIFGEAVRKRAGRCFKMPFPITDRQAEAKSKTTSAEHIDAENDKSLGI